MSVELQDYYRDLILDYSRAPRNKRTLPEATNVGHAVHPDKGDSFQVQVILVDSLIKTITFQGEGSAVALASASIMTEEIEGKSKEQALEISHHFRSMLRSKDAENPFDEHHPLSAFTGIRHLPARVACASLAWQALDKAIS